MAAPMVTRFVGRVLRFNPLKTSVVSAKYGIERRLIDVGHHHQNLAVTSISCAQLQYRLYSQSSPGSGKPPLKKPYTPVGKHDNPAEKHRDAEKEPLEAFPDDINPVTGERGGPKGPEPTRYGDWERKGRCIDF
ncbi:succinate dehydrogenase assembly factor 4, mitochondrial-like [Patiria miniata]|uniref:Succinate dehydrogenase assembly factor 4, mitochondrial n=1 Tax=Patiria miniata TaxID=46514 RepID=A0A914BN50_PATMI|nr:succinate dehydrogenase assembly factor 4, mitochondrial-like [Patiria miniata]